jgi:hypothetical protein
MFHGSLPTRADNAFGQQPGRRHPAQSAVCSIGSAWRAAARATGGGHVSDRLAISVGGKRVSISPLIGAAR